MLPIPQQTDTTECMKLPTEVERVAISYHQGNFGDGIICLEQQLLRALDAKTLDIILRGQMHDLLENGIEVAR